MTELLRLVGTRLRPWCFPLALLAVFETYARQAGQGSDAIAPPSASIALDIAARRAASTVRTRVT